MARALIKTLPLTSWNYGGLLQAYAVQWQFRQLGYSTVFDTPTIIRNSGQLRTASVRKALKSKNVRAPLTIKMRNEVGLEFQRFITENFSTLDSKTMSLEQVRAAYSTQDILVVGSDQVWRPRYAGRVGDYVFEGLDFGVPMVSFAASFGVDSISEFSRADVRAMQHRLPMFRGVSVRERSGVEICAKNFGVQARQIPDPTLLLPRSEYDRLADRGGEGGGCDQLCAVVLDRSDATNSLINEIARTLATDVFWAVPPEPRDGRDYRRNSDAFRRQSVERWLSMIRSARFVVTDSFHGTIFSIIFRKHFVTIGNRARGIDRFVSLLEPLGLLDRLIAGRGHWGGLSMGNIDWSRVEGEIAGQRRRAEGFISDTICRP